LSAWENADTSTAVDFIALFDLIDELITNKHIEADFPFNPIPPFCLLWNLLLNGIVTTLWDSSYDVKYGLDHLYII
ncbi:MAG: hypothetical protein LBC84_10200, partial [Prevotellaceae bacterium]|nr:hypothetical protein [Prevotellaceae bacterium]